MTTTARYTGQTFPQAFNDNAVHAEVKEFYSKLVNKTTNLKSPLCLAACRPVPKHVADALSKVHQEVTQQYCGCGRVISEGLEGTHVLDLGCGSGRDSYILSQLVGPHGSVTGIDMTDELLEVARKYIDYHTERFGYITPNISFRQGYVERLADLGLQKDSYDIIISNCVLNLSPDKEAVLREAYTVLKPGGEMYFSDIFCDRDLPEIVRKDRFLWDECLGGALCFEQLHDLVRKVGFTSPRPVCAGIVGRARGEMKEVLGGSRFLAVTYRLFKLPQEEAVTEACTVIYDGQMRGYRDRLPFDHEYTFETDVRTSVDPELAAILMYSRFTKNFFIKRGAREEKKLKKINAFELAEKCTSGASPGCV